MKNEKFGCSLVLICIGILAFSLRLVSVVSSENVIHEYDPYFNYRTTKYLNLHSIADFFNWFDDRSWYPLGRIVGGTIYPGLMLSASFIYQLLTFVLRMPIAIRNVCVFLAPLFSTFASFSTYLLTYEITKQRPTSLLASLFMGIVPAYISRSVAGSYDNEGVAIFAMINVMYFWLKALATGSSFYAGLCALAYGYLVLSWGGYVFLANLIPIHVSVLLGVGKYSPRLYISYCIFYCLGTGLAMQIPFVGFNVIFQAESYASHGVFLLLQAFALTQFIVSLVPGVDLRSLVRPFIQDSKLRRDTLRIMGLVVMALLFISASFGRGLPWSGRSLALLDPTYASKFLPIVASVSEHQPTNWGNFFMNFGPMLFAVPIGLFYLFEDLTEASMFLIVYLVLAWYFASVMIRLMLTLAPAACVVAAIGFSRALLEIFRWRELREGEENDSTFSAPGLSACVEFLRMETEEKELMYKEPFKEILCFRVPSTAVVNTRSNMKLWRWGLLLPLIYVLLKQIDHSSLVASAVYSSSSITFPSTDKNGTLIIHDDVREGYYWLRQNTPENAKILAWWDYGYQLSSMSNRTILVDNNTWNNTHIATVGLAFASSEEDAVPILESLDVDYVLVYFGGVMHYSGDDLNKFSWFLRIAQGVFPELIYLPEYASPTHNTSSPHMKESVLYKLSYYNFQNVNSTPTLTSSQQPHLGFDNVRRYGIERENITLSTFEEAYTTTNWLLRIYKRLALPNVDRVADSKQLDEKEEE